MRRIHLFSTLMTVVLLTGCAPSQQQFEAAREAVRGSEKTRAFAMRECTTKGWQRKNVQNAAMLLDTTEKLAPRVACKRYLDAFRSGRLEYADAVAFKQGKITPKLIKILQGR